LLAENAERAMMGLPLTKEYKRLDYLTDKVMAQIEVADAEDVEGVATVDEEVMDFLDAFERLLASQLLVVH
jgi:hypothetical protein